MSGQCTFQDLTDLQVICVDDDSTDQSAKIITNYTHKDSRVMLIRHPMTMYAGSCRNTGLVLLPVNMCISWILMTLWKKVHIAVIISLQKKWMQIWSKEKAAVLITPLARFPLPPSFVFPAFRKIIMAKQSVFHRDPSAFSHVSVVPWNGIYKRQFLLEHRLWFNDFICVNDRSFFFNEVSLAADRVVFTKDRLVKYRINNSQSLVGNEHVISQCQFRSFALIRKQCQNYNIPGTARAEILNRELTDLLSRT